MLFNQSFSSHLNWLMVLIPMLNFLSGISVNLYVPSLPSLAIHLDTSMRSTQNTVTASIFGFAIGCIVFGIILDRLERRRIIIFSLIIFILANVSAAHSWTIGQLLSILFLQGMVTAAISIGCRAMIKDYFTGTRFGIAVLYASFAYGFGIMVAPFIGGYLEYYFGWTSAFYALAICGLLTCLSFALFVRKPSNITTNAPIHIFRYYKDLFKDKLFLYGTAVLGCIQLGLMIYPTFAPHFVQNELLYSPIVYGKSSGIVGLGYLLGTLTARFLLSFYSQKQLIHMGLAFSIGSVFLQLLFLMAMELNLLIFILPIVFMGFASGFIFGNLLSELLKSFIHIGLSLSIQLCCIMAISSLGIFVINFFPVTTPYNFFYIYVTIIFLQWSFYVYYHRTKRLHENI